MRKKMVWIFFCLLIVSSCDIFAADYEDGKWVWNQVYVDQNGNPTQVLGYRIYYATLEQCNINECIWRRSQSVVVLANSNNCGQLSCGGEAFCCGDFPFEPPGDIVFIIITAYNEHDESLSEHGFIIDDTLP